LRQNILNPLKDEKRIETRYDIIEEFLANPILLSKVEDKLKYVSDIDAILNRVALERVNPRELLNLKKSLVSILEAFDLIKSD
jgi:DNA mismatch repair protein MutS